LEGDRIANTPAYAYVAKEHATGTMNDPNLQSYLNIFVIKTTHILLALWLVKDNSVNGVRTYLRIDDKNGQRFAWSDHSGWLSRADCRYETATFSLEEWGQALVFYYQF